MVIWVLERLIRQTQCHVVGTQNEMLRIESSATATQLNLSATGPGGSDWILGSSADGASLGAGKFSIFGYGSHKFVIDQNGNVGIGESSPNAQLVVNTQFGASISGSSGGFGVFGSNFAVYNGGLDHNKYYTPYTHGSYGYSGMVARWGALHFFTSDGSTTKDEVVEPESQMVINQSGNIGIGTTSPEGKLDIAGATKYSGPYTGTILFGNTNESGTPTGDGFRIRYDSDFFDPSLDALIVEKTDANHADPDGGIVFVNTGSDGIEEVALAIRGNGNIGIGTTSPSATLSVNGSANKPGGGDWGVYSDRRLKKQVRPFRDGLELLTKVNPVRYRYNGKTGINDDNENVGIIAQEIRELFPYMVSTYTARLNTSDTYDTELLSFDGSALKFVIVNAIKEMDGTIKKLQNTLKTHHGTIKKRDQTIERLNKTIKKLDTRLTKIEAAPHNP